MKKQIGLTPTGAWVLAVFCTLCIFGGLYFVIKTVSDVPEIDIAEEVAKETLAKADRGKKKKEEILGVDSGKFSDWSYKSPTGPDSWGDLSPAYLDCSNGRGQSPVDIQKVEAENRLYPISFNYRTTTTSLKHIGHTIEAVMKNSGHIRVKNNKYSLRSIHFRLPSEHLIKGVPFDMEVQLIHQSVDGEKAVVAVMLEESDFRNDTIAKLWQKIPRKLGVEEASLKLNAAKLLPKNRSYFYYQGSMTTPPCVEGVQWYVLTDSVKVSAREIDIFNSVFLGNARPVQPLYNRKIVKGKG